MTPNIRECTSDGFEALTLVARLSWRSNLKAWVQVPFGIVLILLACFGVHALIGLSSVSFPASVACLILLFLLLNAVDLVNGHQRTRALVSVIDVPAGWALRYINLFFTPSFVLLPLSDYITAAEVGKIIGVFLVGFLVMFAVTAWLVRGLQILVGSSKRAITERAEEMGAENDAIPLALSNNANFTSTDTTSPIQEQEPVVTRDASDPRSSPETESPPPEVVSSTITVQQVSLPLTRSQIWAALINRNLDILTYSFMFLFIGIPVYYATGYAMPIQLTFNVLAYFAAQSLPVRWKQFLHPVLLSSGITIIGIWILGLLRGNKIDEILGAYKTDTKYIAYWDGEKNLPLPGAGDIFNSVLDASIVSLALPMFQYRHELKSHFIPIIIPSVALAVASLFAYPPLCLSLGISPPISLSFSVRSLTLALATPAASNLGANLNAAAALAIMSGILGVLIGQRLLALLRVRPDDYITIGVAMGGNASAIATALLLASDPRAAALGSLSMSLFGIVTLVLTSVPPVVEIVRGMVGL
ncbi:hypothetical protein DSL72_008832 [Monilinia vaccinii-corymbosi]|uniref:LrgB-like protein n=1 Tax=Monilinia vaccinii-corymbosi TaxID=61207 RepID=A0A8A3PRT2_9HELO|nr:hypothetical protein DSL72_008832 [Monilinia vaccinii-corymbosi]